MTHRQHFLNSLFRVFSAFFFLLYISAVDSYASDSDFFLQALNHVTAKGNMLVRIAANREMKPERTGLNFELSIRKEKGNAPVVRKLLMDASKDNSFEFTLSPGNYLIGLEWSGNLENEPGFKQISFQCAPPGKEPWLSDISLFTCPDEKPLISDVIKGNANAIHFSAQVFAQKQGIFAARAVLFRKEVSGSGLSTNQYVSVSQIKQVVATAGNSIFENDFDLENAAPGEYLIELYLYRHEHLFLAVNRSFRVEWKGLPQLFSTLNTSIEMMAPLCSKAFKDSLIMEKDIEKKQELFTAFWKKRNPTGSPYATWAMEQYYSRIYAAASRFAEPAPAWKRDRVLIWTWLGQPDTKNTVSLAGSEYEIWYYDTWGLKIPFRKVKGNYYATGMHPFSE